MAAPELRLNVTLDLAAFRTQLGKLAQASAAYYYPVNLLINKKNFETQLKELSRIKPVINIEDSQLIAARTRIATLNKSLATLRSATSTPIEIKVKYKEEGRPASGTGAVGRAITGRAAGQEALENKSRAELQKLYGLFREANLRVSELSKGLKKSSENEIRDALVPAFSDSGEEAVNGLAIGLKDPSSKVSKAAERLAKGTVQDIKKVFGIASPAKTGIEIGKDVIDGLEIGLGDFNSLRTKMVGEMRQFISALKREAKVGGIALGGLLSPITKPAGFSTRTTPGVTAPTRAEASMDPGRGNQRILNSLSLLTGDPALYRSRMSNLGAGRLPSSLLGAAQNQFDLEELVPSFKQARIASGTSPLDKIIDDAFFGRGTLPKAQSALSTLNNALERLGNAARTALPPGILQSASGRPRMRTFGGVAPSQTMGIFEPTARPTSYPPSGGFLEFSRRATAISAGLPGNVFGGSGASRNTLGGFGGSSPPPPPPPPPPGGGGFPSDGMMGPSATKGYEALTRLSGALRQSSVFFNQSKIPLAGAIEELGGEFAQAAKQVLLYGTAYKALAFFIDLPRQVLTASTSLQTFNNQLLAITGSSAGAERSFTFVDNLATRFNVPLESARQGFVKLYASMAPAGFETGQIEALYTGISKASATLGLSADKVDRVTYAFAQMSSKGQLMAEEVTGQLGDVIPGALSIMAEAARMDIATFKKAMEDGAFTGKAFEQVMSNVPIVLEQRFGKGAAGAAQTLQGSMNALATATTKFHESFNALVQSGSTAIFPVIADAIDQATKAAAAFSAAATGNMGPANMLEGTAKKLYIAMRQLQEIFIAIGNVIKDIAPTFAILGRLALGLLSALSQLINTAVGRFLTDLAVKAGVALIAIQLLTKTGITLLASQLITLARNALLAGTGFVGFAKGLMATATAARIARLALIGLGAGLVLTAIEALIKYIDRTANRLGNMRKAALDAAEAIRSMSSTQLVKEKTQRQKDIALLEKVQRSGGDIGSEAERKRLEEIGLKTGTRGLQRRVMDPSLIESYLQRERQLLTEVEYAYDNLDQPTPVLGEVDATGGKDDTTEKTNLESYHKLRDDLAKMHAQHLISLDNETFRHAKSLAEMEFEAKEAFANEYQTRQIKEMKKLHDIEMQFLETIRKARAAVYEASMSTAPGNAGTMGGGGRMSIVDVGKALQKAGFTVKEHPAFGGVTPGVHSPTGYHPTGEAIDVTDWRGGDWKGRTAALKRAMSGAGFAELLGPGDAGHETHVHLAVGSGGISQEMFNKALASITGGAGVPAPVKGSVARDTRAEVSTELRQKEALQIEQNALTEALKQYANTVQANMGTIFPIAQLKLENQLMEQRNQLQLQGMPSEYIEFREEMVKTEYESLLAVENYRKELDSLNEELAQTKPTKDNAAQIKFLEGRIQTLNDAIASAPRLLQEMTVAQLENTIASIKQADALKKMQEGIELIDSNVESATGGYKNFIKEVAMGGDPTEALKKFQQQLTDQVLTIILDYSFKPVEEFLKNSLKEVFGLPSEEKQRQAVLAKLEEQLAKQERIALATERTADNTGPGRTEGAGNTASIFNDKAITNGLNFENITGSLSQSMEKIGKSFESGLSAVDTSAEGWNQALTTNIPDSLKTATDSANTQGSMFAQGLGKTVAAIGLAAGSIMGIAAGISQIKEGGTSNVLGGIGSIFMSLGGAVGGFAGLLKGANGGVASGGWKPFPVTAFANGGMVNGPTLGLVGEGKYNEAIVPLPDGRSIPVQMKGFGGGELREAMSGSSGRVSGSPILNMSFQSTNINGVEYVSRDQLEQAMAATRRQAASDGAKRGMSMTLDKLQQSPSTRSRLGIGGR